MVLVEGPLLGLPQEVHAELDEREVLPGEWESPWRKLHLMPRLMQLWQDG
jgi:hypothetical protein